MSHEERARFAQARAYERMQRDGLLPYDGEGEDARKARRAAILGRSPMMRPLENSYGLPVYPPAPDTMAAALAELRAEVAALRERVAVLEKGLPE